MSEAVYLLPRVDGTTNQNSCKQFARTTAFGTAGLVVSAKKGRLYKLSVVNSSATRYIVQIFDKATAPVNSDAAIWEVNLPATSGCEVDFGLNGLAVTNGIGVALSTTKGTLTLAAATDGTAYALYTSAP